jgi:NAD(P)-dependent dehydrogenase (short-subunit alcohol dehydrogenase family)
MILITGASGGIGKYLLETFAAVGLPVSGTYNSKIPDKTENYTKVDITNPKEITSWLKHIGDKLTNITLINSAGINYNAFAHKSDLNAWSKVIEINLLGTFNVIHAVLPIMREQNFGRIINLSSIVGQMGAPGASAYAASKSSFWGLAKSIALENATKGITINNLNLGYFNMGIIREVPEKYREIIKKKIPTGEFGTPEQIYTTVKYLMETSYINGSSIDVNGGAY